MSTLVWAKRHTPALITTLHLRVRLYRCRKLAKVAERFSVQDTIKVNISIVSEAVIFSSFNYVGMLWVLPSFMVVMCLLRGGVYEYSLWHVLYSTAINHTLNIDEQFLSAILHSTASFCHSVFLGRQRFQTWLQIFIHQLMESCIVTVYKMETYSVDEDIVKFSLYDEQMTVGTNRHQSSK